MEREELVKDFNQNVDQYSKHKSYMDKARDQADQFSSGVIEKVIADHQIKASMIADEILPMVPKLQAELSNLNVAIDAVEQSKGDFSSKIEELKLRLAIGEITDEEYEAQGADGRETVESADLKIGELAADRDILQVALDRWSELSGDVVAVEAVVEAEAEDAADPVVDSILPGFEDESEFGLDDSVEIEADSVGFDMEDAADEYQVDVAAEGEGEAIEVAIDGESDAEEEAPVAEEEDAGGESEASSDEEEEAAEDAESAEPRRALLLSNEGSPEEQIYALTGDVFTVGRGRDNDLQIKNDSKVSRFHCKIFRRGNNYYIEDNKSSNGTMINGELISERRLFGGEEVIIGETFYRFRVM